MESPEVIEVWIVLSDTTKMCRAITALSMSVLLFMLSILLCLDGVTSAYKYVSYQGVYRILNIAIGPAGKTISIVDTAHNVITFDAGSGQELSSVTIYDQMSPYQAPSTFTLDGRGDIFLLSNFDRQLTQLSADGARVINNFTHSNATWTYPQQVAVDLNGFIYLTDRSNVLLKLTSSGQQIALFQTANPPLNNPTGIAVDRAGNIYVTDTGNSRLIKLNASGDVVLVYDTPNIKQFSPTSIAVDNDGNAFVTDLTNSNLVVFFAANGSVINVVNSSVSTVGIAWSPATKCAYVADNEYTDNGQIVPFTLDGRQLQPFVSKYVSFESVYGIRIDSTQTIHVADASLGIIFKLYANGSLQSTIPAPNDQCLSMASLELDLNGNYYTGIYSYGLSSVVCKLSSTGKLLQVYNFNDYGSPNSIAVDEMSNIYIAMSYTIGSNILKLSSDGILIKTFNHTSLSLVIDIYFYNHTGYLYIADSYNDRILIMDPNTGNIIYNITVISPNAITVDYVGNLYIASDRSIYKLSRDGQLLDEYVAIRPMLTMMKGIAVDMSATHVFVTEWFNPRIVAFSLEDDFIHSSINSNQTNQSSLLQIS